jgi:2-polyprenyl-3-methyl-5-hydroxy-6-metoxy-1,4-benzoquinol methylase
MEPSQVAESYDRIAHQWLDGHLDTNGIALHEHALKFRPSGGRAIDLGCGCNGRFLNLLATQGYEIEGLDASARMIALARERQPGVAFIQADLCTWLPDKAYEFITAWDSLWHVPLAEAENVVRKIGSALAPGGIFITTTGGLDAPAEKMDSAMGPPMHYSVLGIPRTLQVLAE